MRRREFLALLGGAAVSWPLAARAQQPAVPMIGILGGQSPETYEPFLVPFRQGLSEVGFVEGNNVAIESRWAQGRYDRLPDLADVLVSRRVALIYAVGGTEVALAAKAATQIIPIVITIGGDPVKAGLVASLNRPGGNLTGTSFYTVGLGTKRLELLYELVPRASVIAVLMQTGSPIAEEQLSDLQQAATALRLRLVVLAVTGDADLEPAFAKVAVEGAGVGSSRLPWHKSGNSSKSKRFNLPQMGVAADQLGFLGRRAYEQRGRASIPIAAGGKWHAVQLFECGRG